MSLRERVGYEFLWVCSFCGRLCRHVIERVTDYCYRCKTSIPQLVRFVYRRQATIHSKDKTRANKVLDILGLVDKYLPREALEDMAIELNLCRTLPKLPKGHYVTQVFYEDTRYAAIVPFDPVGRHTPIDIRTYMAKDKVLQIRLDADIYSWFKKFAHAKELSMSAIVTAYLTTMRDKYNKAAEVKQI